METTNQAPAIQALREYASAIRGDWGDIDGRSVKHQLETIADALEGDGRTSGWPINAWREDMGVCPSGEGHWTRHCQPFTPYDESDPTDGYGCGNAPSLW